MNQRPGLQSCTCLLLIVRIRSLGSFVCLLLNSASYFCLSAFDLRGFFFFVHSIFQTVPLHCFVVWFASFILLWGKKWWLTGLMYVRSSFGAGWEPLETCLFYKCSHFHFMLWTASLKMWNECWQITYVSQCLCKVSLMRGLIGGCTFLKSSFGSQPQPSLLHFESTFQLCVSSCTYCHRLCGLDMWAVCLSTFGMHCHIHFFETMAERSRYLS